MFEVSGDILWKGLWKVVIDNLLLFGGRVSGGLRIIFYKGPAKLAPGRGFAAPSYSLLFYTLIQ